MRRSPVMARIQPEIREQIERLAKQESRTFSAMIELLLASALQIYEGADTDHPREKYEHKPKKHG